MKTAVWWIGALALSVSFWGCAGGDGGGGGGDAQPQPECVDDDGCEDGQVCVEGVCVDDEVNNEPNNDVNNEMDAGNNAPDMGDGEDEEEPDELIETGEPCDEDDDCQGGTCVQLGDGRKICTEFCSDDSCPEGFDCTFVENSGADAVFLCFPAVDFLCVPCAVDANCGGRSDRCLSYNNGSFCGSTCSNDAPCPEDYDCVATEVEGEEQPVLQCVRSDGFCCMQTNGGVEICDGIDNDCNGRVDDGFEDSNDVENCGACGQVCELPGAAVECVSGECLLTECEADAYNLDGDDSNGCEYECVFIGELDLPDPTFRDDNCDGTDGNVDAAVFVAPAPIGSPEGTGTLEDPVSTLALGIELARQDPDRGYLIVAEGIYNETVELADGISIFGGYRVGEHRWERLSVQEAPTVVGAGRVGMTARNILLPTVVSNLQIQSDGAAMSGTSSYGLRVINASDALVIRGNVIAAGNGANGVDGQTGADGQPGGRGGDGEGGCDGCSGRGSAGTAGASVCGSPGGAGGRGGYEDDRGDRGANGVGPAGGNGGVGGNGNGNSCLLGCDNADHGAGGGVGGDGGSGGNGGPGDANGGRDGDDWLGGSGQRGAAGVNGSGGGGGGGGGGSSCCRDDRGGGGGGGGGGGCGGDGGTGGQGGGASIGVLLLDASPLLQNNVITSAIGGAGGAGAVGGTGGNGGAFGAAGGPADESGPGGVGGAGGAGGNGGCGGGGAGGPSIGVLVGPGSVPSLMANEVTPGMGGPGGGSCGNAGPDGTAAEQL